MSPALQRAHELDQHRERRQAAERARQRQIAAEEWETRQIAASLVLAEDRGELPTRQERMTGVARTKAEALAFYSAQGDLEDARRAAQARGRSS